MNLSSDKLTEDDSDFVTLQNVRSDDMDNYSLPSTSSQLQIPVLQYSEVANMSGLLPSNQTVTDEDYSILNISNQNIFDSIQKHNFSNSTNNKSNLATNQINNSRNYNDIITSLIKEKREENHNHKLNQKRSNSLLNLQKINQQSI